MRQKVNKKKNREREKALGELYSEHKKDKCQF
jgi:hypothetical protein